MRKPVIRLNLRQNALHALYHGVEHLYRSDPYTEIKEGRSFDHEEHTVEWRNEHGHLCFALAEFTLALLQVTGTLSQGEAAQPVGLW